VTVPEFSQAVDARIRLRTDLPTYTFVNGIWSCDPMRANLFEADGGVRAASYAADTGMLLGYSTGASAVFPLTDEGVADVADLIGGWISNYFMWR
jgi:hypothetical protein